LARKTSLLNRHKRNVEKRKFCDPNDNTICQVSARIAKSPAETLAGDRVMRLNLCTQTDGIVQSHLSVILAQVN
jgi:predicted RNA-binding Zn ribbon-like protein